MNQDLRQLIGQAQSGDKKAFATLVYKFQNRIFSAVYGVIGNRQDAEDIAQEVFIKAYKNISKLNSAESFSKWLLRIAINTAINYKKKVACKIDTRMGEFTEFVYQGETPEEYVEQKETTKILGAVLAELSPEHRAVLFLREFEGLAYDEIANFLDIPLGTVKSRINHAREKLRQGLVRGDKHEVF